jgi:putative endopeptidase
MTRYVAVLLVVLLFFACQTNHLGSGIDLTMMDKSIAPQADFYRYMNGTWLKTFDIPADKSNYGSFEKLRDVTEQNLRTIIEEVANTPNKAKGSAEQKVGDLYASFMDSAKVEQLGIKPIEGDLAAIKGLESKADLIARAASLAKEGVSGPFFHFVHLDAKNTTQYIVKIYQGGLSLPDRDYYLKDDAKFREIRKKFLSHMEKMFTLAGYKGVATKATQVMNIEMQIAKVHWSNVENRDRTKTYNKFAIADLNSLTPAFDWKFYARQAGFGGQESLIVYQPSYIKGFGDLFAKASLDDWKTYYAWRVLTWAAPYLSSSYVNEDFDFFGRTIKGIQELRPRWKRGVNSVEDGMGELVGKVYVGKYFKPEAKQRMVELVANLKDAYAERIKGLGWMGAETKTKALQKLNKFGSKIGYPDVWRDYTKLEIVPGDLLGNVKRANQFEYERQLDKLGKPIDRTEWFMTPQTINAYYSPEMNEVVFPAAILQPPFFNVEADEAVNYGAIGAGIGHEMTHGFDDQGRKSDGDGNLTDWWTKEDAEEFTKRAQVMVAQYSQYSPIDTLKVNGQLTLGENIADLGGLTIAYYAYKKSMDGKEAPIIDGLTGDQRFFLGWAQIWARKYRDDELRRRLLVDPHSPSEYRTNGIVANMPEFYAAYNVKQGDPLFRPDSLRVKIW